MKIKTVCFVVIPLIFFGCGAYHYMSQSQERPNQKPVPKNKEDLKKAVEEAHVRKR